MRRFDRMGIVISLIFVLVGGGFLSGNLIVWLCIKGKASRHSRSLVLLLPWLIFFPHVYPDDKKQWVLIRSAVGFILLFLGLVLYYFEVR